jgi:hypothetical protein
MRRTCALLVIVVALLTACADDPEPPAPIDNPLPDAINGTPLVNPTLTGCDVGALEDWYQVAVTNFEAVMDESLTYGDLDTSAALTVAGQVSQRVDRVLLEETPECMDDLQAIGVAIFLEMQAALVAYGEGQIDQETLDTRIAVARTAYQDDVDPLMQVTERQLRELLQND